METHQKFIKWFKIVAVLAIVWNILGVMAYLMQITMTSETIQVIKNPAARALYENIPTWYTVIFGIAVFTGLLGSILLLIKKRIACSFFLISFITVVIQLIYNLFIAKTHTIFGASSMIMPAFILLIALFLLWYSRKMDELAYIH